MKSKGKRRAIELSLLPKCPVRCKYCPQDALQAAYDGPTGRQGLLTPVDALKAVTNASATPGGHSPIDVHFAGFSEPLLSPDFAHIFLNLETSPLVHEIVMFSTGNGLKPDFVDMFDQSQKLKLIDWHLRPEAENVNGRFYSLLPMLKAISTRQRATLVRYETDRFDRRKTTKRIPFELRYMPAVSRANNNLHLIGNVVRQPVTCCKVSTAPMPVVLPNGDAVACCNDYSLELPIGNLFNQTWNELDFESVRRLQRDPSSNALCYRNCHIARIL